MLVRVRASGVYCVIFSPPPQDNPKFVMPMKERYAYIRNRTKGKR